MLRSEQDVFVVLGNGMTERKLLSWLAPKLDGKRVALAFVHPSIEAKGRAGLAALDMLSEAMHRRPS